MTPELTALALSGLLQMVQLTLFSVTAQKQVGTKNALKPRDTQITLTGTPGRIHRAMNNHFEGLILFTLAVTVVTLSDQSTTFTQACAWTYLAARIAYIPAYALGWVPWRSLIWMVGITATTLMLLASFV